MISPRAPRIAIVGAGPAGLTFTSVLHHLLTTPTPSSPPPRLLPEINIYERSTALASRDQGGTLDMHGPTGQRALKLAGLWDKFQEVARPEGEAMRIMDKSGRVWMGEGAEGPPEEFAGSMLFDGPGPGSGGEGPGEAGKGAPGAKPQQQPAPAAGAASAESPPEASVGAEGTNPAQEPASAAGQAGEPDSLGLPKDPDGRPEIDRGLLNSLLIDSLPPSTLHWGKSVTSISPLPSSSGAHQLTFSDGSQEAFDLVLGADGAYSCIRGFLTPVGPFYSGVTMLEALLRDVDSNIPQVGEFVGPGSIMAFGDNKALGAQRNSGDRVRVYFHLRVPETCAEESGIDWSSVGAAKERVKKLFEGWNEKLVSLIDYADPEALGGRGIALRKLYMLPPDNFRWAHTRGVTLLGDAAHLMTPFAGEGANMAMADGADLAQFLFPIFTSPSATDEQALLANLDAAVRKYESVMFPRAGSTMRDTWASMEAFINPDAPASGFRYFMESFKAPEGGREEERPQSYYEME